MIREITFQEGADLYRARMDEGSCISLPLRDGEENPSCYHADIPEFETIRVGSFIGSVKAGGSVNHKRLHLSPHGNGTHTECYGHISADETSIHQCLQDSLSLCEVVSMQPKSHGSGLALLKEDFIESMRGKALPESIVLRSLPNHESKRTAKYSGTNPPYLEPELCAYLAEHKVRHLLVDLPSLDPEVDGGLLAAHKAFWQYPGSTRKNATVTELIYVPDSIKDGLYLLHLQIAPLQSDASPSRVFLHPVQKLTHVSL
jgi:kynurenine formamidase